MEKIIALLFMSRTMAHMAHLKTTGEGSYAKHTALGGFYDSLVDLTDGLAEAYQGKYGIMEIEFMDEKGDINDPIAMLESHLNMFTNLSKRIEDRYLQNMLDGVTELYYSTLYKLKNLE